MEVKNVRIVKNMPDWQEWLQDRSFLFEIKTWRVIPWDNCIRDEDEVKYLGRKVMELLVYFASRPGEVCSKKDIMDQVWEHRFVSDMALTVAVSHLRSALGDNARAPNYLKTIPGVGYKFLIQPKITPTRIAKQGSAPKHRHLKMGRWLGVGLIILVGFWLVPMATKLGRREVESKDLSGTAPKPLAAFQLTNYTGLNGNSDELEDFENEMLASLSTIADWEMVNMVNQTESLFDLQGGSRFGKCLDYLVEAALLSGSPRWHWTLKVTHLPSGEVVCLMQGDVEPIEVRQMVAMVEQPSCARMAGSEIPF